MQVSRKLDSLGVFSALGRSSRDGRALDIRAGVPDALGDFRSHTSIDTHLHFYVHEAKRRRAASSVFLACELTTFEAGSTITHWRQ